jgi:hypothetical protein
MIQKLGRQLEDEKGKVSKLEGIVRDKDNKI